MRNHGLRTATTIITLSALIGGCGGSAGDAAPAAEPHRTALLASVVSSSFGLTSDATYYTIDTGGGLVFKVRRTDNGSSTQSAGDIASMIYNGVQYQDQSRGTQVNSGFDFLYTGISAVTVNAEAVGSDYIKVTVTGGGLTHYYMAKRGDPKIYMGTYFTSEPSTLNLARFIVRVPIGVLPNGTAAGTPGGLVDGAWPDDLRATNGAIESSDIFGITSGPFAGQTRSKHYSNMRLKDWSYIGGTGPGVGLWIVRDNQEGGSGGPFYRSLLNQITSTNNEITYIVNYGEGQTEGFRLNRLNSYTLSFTNGTAPTAVDTSWFGGMGLFGYVAPNARGGVFLPSIAGRNGTFAYTVGFANANAQYWADAATNDGHTSSDGMIPGDYTMTVYKNELAVATAPVTVTAGTTNIIPALTIVADPLTNADDPRGKWHLAKGDPSITPALFRIGEWDGTPREFLNGDKITVMHPQDIRMSPWFASAIPTKPYLVGTSKAATDMPAYQWKGLVTGAGVCAVNPNAPNQPVTVQFNLKASQISAASTYKVRVGVTTGQAGARPQINVNSWVSPYIGSQSGDVFPPAQPTTRTMTVGTYRARNITYDYNVPSTALVVGANTLKLSVVSGSCSTSPWLTPSYAFDAIDLIKTP
ncbi:MAG: rhamnogalacturonan lyase B N-terminal domain-containing protein [Pseudomonadota bacterium]|nr:rhamnogalacturonan lyase B N-terminal domain-containing protein [Pseudomonadota bacterium]